MKTMMKCGHAANATDAKTGQPCCAICIGLDAGADQVDDAPDLAGRMARCAYCRCERSSEYARDHEAFFERVPDRDYDRFYCGCRGWD